MKAIIVIVVFAVIVIVVVVLMNVIMRRKGYGIPGKTAVRCSKGYLFRTTWIEGGSFVSIRLGPKTRFHYCPIGKHWAIIHPIKEADLTDADRKQLSAQ